MRSLIKKIVSPESRNRIRSHLPKFMHRKVSYSQCGEDLLIEFLLNIIDGKRPRKYLDVGANHPYHLSNTAFFYSKGGSGLLVEPDPRYASLLRQKRSRDTILQAGVHFSGGKAADFYVMDSPTLNTFSHHEMERYVSMGHRLVDTLLVNLKDINEILEISGKLDLLNLDIEGLDLAVLEMVNWDKYRPTCICVETINYECQHEPIKSDAIIDFVLSQGYILYADTFINSIFVERNRWVESWSKQPMRVLP
jgi:FkbM family methyltransferase